MPDDERIREVGVENVVLRAVDMRRDLVKVAEPVQSIGYLQHKTQYCLLVEAI